MCAWGRTYCTKPDNRLEKRAVAGPFTGAVEGVDRGDGLGCPHHPATHSPFLTQLWWPWPPVMSRRDSEEQQRRSRANARGVV